jgi:DNA-binding CsgD family transcriptional regulator/tetratricopeptide (TPR) repeat protein
MTQRLSSRAFAGRTGELAQLLAALARCAEGSPAVVLVGGDAGIGKSRLIAELAARAADDGEVRVLWGQCADLEEAAIPLLPLANAFRDVGDDLLATAMPRAVSPSAQLSAAPAARLHTLVLDHLAQASASAPVLLLLEDIHWADRSTLDVLAFLARRLRHEHVLIAATYRSNEVDQRPSLRRFLADIATAPTAQRLELAGLERDAMREQIGGILGAAPPPDLVADVFARSEGNPFFAEELVAVAGSGSTDALSPTLRDMLLARIAALDADVQAVVRVAAAGGRQVHHRLLAAAAGIAEPELTEALRAAVSHQVLVATDDGFAFRHALLQEVCYRELLPGERAMVHAAFAHALESGADASATVAAEIAHHWLRAGDKPRALVASVRAGDEAERIGALAEAAGHDAHALELWDVVAGAEELTGVDRVTVLARAAYANAWTGRPAEAHALIDAAIALVDPAAEPVRAAMLHTQRGRYFWHLGRTPEGVEELERAVALIPAEPPTAERARALDQLALTLMLVGDYTRSRELCEAAIAVAQAIGARVEEADALICLGQDLVGMGDRSAGLEVLRRARSIATEIGDDEVLSHVAVGLSDGLWRDGQLAQAIEVALDGAQASRRVGLEVRECICNGNAAEAAYELGRWDLVDELTRDMLARDLSGVPLAFAHHTAGALARGRGDLAAAEAHVAAQRDAVGHDAAWAEGEIIEDEAQLALWQRRPEAASTAARRGAEVMAHDALICLTMAWLGLRAEADRAELARARRDDEAERAARERASAFRDTARECVAAAAHPSLEAAIAAEQTRADGDSDPALWDAAASAWEARPAPFQGAYARWRQAEAALARRDREPAARALLAAHGVAVDLGAGALRSELEALARRARIELADGEPASAEEAESGAPAAVAELGLTARELEVLEHLALGQTNRQIADELFISVKTAGVHVSHILSKLGAANRGEAGAIAHRLGLVP